MGADFGAHLAEWSQYAGTWGFLAIFLLMAIESSFIPFPSEVVMIPAGFLAARGELTLGNPWADMILAIFIGVAGSLVGAYINYYLALWLGEPFLRKYGKYFFIKPPVLDRAQAIFREYGAPATFVCRLLPAIRQLISLPAGLAAMPLGQFTLYTGLGAGLWTIILTAVGFFLVRTTTDMTYEELIPQGKAMITAHYGWIIAGLVLFVVAYWAISRWVMKERPKRVSNIS